MALEIFIFIGLFAMGLSLLVDFLGETDHDKRKMRAAHERRRYGLPHWD